MKFNDFITNHDGYLYLHGLFDREISNRELTCNYELQSISPSTFGYTLSNDRDIIKLLSGLEIFT